MRIGIITGEYPPMQGGVGDYSRLLAEALLYEGHDIHILSSVKAHSDLAALHVTRLPGWGAGCLRAARRWARQHNLDAVSLQYQTAAYGMSPWIHLLPRALHPLPVITTCHDLRFPYLFPKAGPLRLWIVRQLVASSKGVIVTNAQDEAQVRAWLPAERVSLIPIGSNISATLPPNYDRDAWRTRAGWQPQDFVVGYFGLLNHSKGVDTLLTALRQMIEAGLPARLVIIGGTQGSSDPSNRDYSIRIQEQIRQYALEPHIHWTGHLEDKAEVAGWLRASDVVALPFRDGASERRGSLLAALTQGCPIVTTRPTAPNGFFRDDDNLLLVPPDEVGEMAKALRRLHAEPALRERLGRAAKVTAANFAWPQIADQHTAFLTALTEDAP